VQGVKTHPVQLRNPSKLVYSPHVYGPSVYGQPYFSVGNFPANMPAIWDTHFGFVPSTTGAVSPPNTPHMRTAHAGRTHRTRARADSGEWCGRVGGGDR
jgi:aryl-phospho-beta-D-glucosidase BglC (GH1 family)